MASGKKREGGKRRGIPGAHPCRIEIKKMASILIFNTEGTAHREREKKKKKKREGGRDSVWT